MAKKTDASPAPVKKSARTKKAPAPAAPAKKRARAKQPLPPPPIPAPLSEGPDARVLDRLFATVHSRRDADPNQSHSARLLSRGVGKVAQKFGEEAVEAVIESITGNTTALIGESADVLYHLLVMWVATGVEPTQVWAELARREGISGIAEKAARKPLLFGFPTKKIP